MPRPLSWLPRLHEISRSVQNSIRSHYGRRDLEILFELQPRAAQKLLEILPTVKIGTSLLVEREILAGFLGRVRDTDDTAALFEEMRKSKTTPSRRKVRELVTRDIEPGDLSSLPSSIGLTRGRLEVNFASVLELAEALYAIARVIESEEFAQLYEPYPPAAEPSLAGEAEKMFAELVAAEAQRPI